MVPKLNPQLRRSLTVIIYILFLCTDVFFSNWDSIFGPQNCNEVALATRMWYQRVVTLGYRKPKPHFVRVVTVTPPNNASACDYRKLLAGLLLKIRDLQPAIVVLDYSFSPHDCGDATKQLQNAIDDLSANIPMVFGQKSYTLEELKDDSRISGELKPLTSVRFGENDQAVWPSDISADSTKPIVMALYRLDCDTRRIPLTWPVYAKNDNGIWVKLREQEPTIAFAAATLYDNTLRELPAHYRSENPFTSFIPQELFSAVDAGALSISDRPRFQHRIVIIGDAINDVRASVIGRLPGVFLQANYIESLLDDRYFRGLGPLMTAGTTFLFLFIVGFIFDKSRKVGAALLRSVCLWLMLILASYVALVYFALLLTFWVPVAPAIVIGMITKAHSQ
jgi:hypothetical protein